MSNLFSSGYDGERFEYEGRIDEENFDNLLLWCTEKRASDVTIQTNLPIALKSAGSSLRSPQDPSIGEIEGMVRYIYGKRTS